MLRWHRKKWSSKTISDLKIKVEFYVMFVKRESIFDQTEEKQYVTAGRWRGWTWGDLKGGEDWKFFIEKLKACFKIWKIFEHF